MRMTSVNRLGELALEGQHGKHWYEKCDAALRSMCRREGWPIIHTAAILGITSPRVRVSRNAAITKAYMREWVVSPDINTHTRLTGLMPMVRRGLEKYERLGIISGPKTSAFAGACMGDLSQVVLDTWMATALGLDQKNFDRKLHNTKFRVRHKATMRINKVAKQLGWQPAQVQASIWTAVYEQHHVQRAPGLDTYL